MARHRADQNLVHGSMCPNVVPIDHDLGVAIGATFEGRPNPAPFFADPLDSHSPELVVSSESSVAEWVAG
jgi:hypothetical protein